MPSTSEHLVLLAPNLQCLGLESMCRMAEVPTVLLPFTSESLSVQEVLCDLSGKWAWEACAGKQRWRQFQTLSHKSAACVLLLGQHNIASL